MCGGVEEADQEGNVAVLDDDGGKLGGIRGEKGEERVEGLVLEIDGADLKTGEEVAEEEGEVGGGGGEDDGIGMWIGVDEEAGAEEEVEVVEVEGEGGGGDVEIALEEKLAGGERGVEAAGGEGMQGAEGGEEGGEEVEEERVVGRGVHGGGEGRAEEGELGVEETPAADEGLDGEGGG